MGHGVGVQAPDFSTFPIRVFRFLLLVKVSLDSELHAGSTSRVGPVERWSLLDLNDAQGVLLGR